ncbi:hypothetical protein [Bacteroides sp.]|jgi:hypothetical protein|uniref:hypothetical protein n=1 Tax=Bacteroides sp. TaxID=29523 RepID=UPI003D12EC08
MISESDITKWKEKPDWFDRINFEEYEKLAAIGYSPKQIAMYYQIKYIDFEWYFNLVGSPLQYHYKRGQLMQQAKEGIAMAISAETGENVTQAQRLDKLRREVEFSNAINNIFYGDIE